MATVEVKSQHSEWLVCKQGPVTVCVGVRDGEVTEVRILGLGRDQVDTDLYHVQQLAMLLTEVDRVVAAARDRTRAHKNLDDRAQQ